MTEASRKARPPLRGSKVRRGVWGGGAHSLHDDGPDRNDFKADYGRANRIQFDRDITRARRGPIRVAAIDLLVDYHRRRAFWDATRAGAADPMPVELAGLVYLDVKRSRANDIKDELEGAGGPWPWFRDRALEGIRSGKIAQGHATARCRYADRFFVLLGGGAGRLEDADWVLRGGRSVVEIGSDSAREGLSEAEIEALEYRYCR